MDVIFSQFQELTDLSRTHIFQLIITFLSILSFITIRFLFLKAVLKKNRRVAIQTWKINSGYVTGLASVLVIAVIWIPDLRTFFALFSIVGAGLIIVLKEVFLNLAGWMYIITRKPFEVGNRILVDEHIGDVIDIRLMEFSILEVKKREEGGQSTGRVIRIPNSFSLTRPVGNASKEFSFYWNEVTIPITPESDWKKAVDIIESIAQMDLEQIYTHDRRLMKAEKSFSIIYKQITPKVYVDFKDTQIQLTLRHLSEPRKTRDLTDKIWRHILTEFAEQRHIHLA